MPKRINPFKRIRLMQVRPDGKPMTVTEIERYFIDNVSFMTWSRWEKGKLPKSFKVLRSLRDKGFSIDEIIDALDVKKF